MSSTTRINEEYHIAGDMQLLMLEEQDRREGATLVSHVVASAAGFEAAPSGRQYLVLAMTGQTTSSDRHWITGGAPLSRVSMWSAGVTATEKKVEWDIRNASRAWRSGETMVRWQLTPRKREMIEGKLLWSDEDRLLLLGLLLENVGADRVVRLGDPEAWRAAAARLSR